MEPTEWYNRGLQITDLNERQRYFDAGREFGLAFHPWVHIGAGSILLNRGDYTGAAAAYERALTIDPGNAGAWNNLGFARNQLGDHMGAVAAYERALALDLEGASAWFSLAMVYEGDLQRSAEALYCFERAAELGFSAPGGGFVKLLRERGVTPEAPPVVRAREEAEAQARAATAERARMDKLAKLVRVSRSLEIPQMARILGLSEDALYERIVDWAAEYGFTLVRQVVDFTGGRKEAFVAELEREWVAWENMADKK